MARIVRWGRTAGKGNMLARAPEGWRRPVFKTFGFDGKNRSGHLLHMIGDNNLPEIFSQQPEVLSGALVFNGTRIPVETFFEHLDHGGTLEDLLQWYDGVGRKQAEAARENRPATTA
ncbi:MAG TPA: DUF433 domain-containing protein [Candidatus Limnocylindria bacterium]|nr:DUF433 domain-containing protein [Candidatus Limnocylindria bacterium]